MNKQYTGEQIVKFLKSMDTYDIPGYHDVLEELRNLHNKIPQVTEFLEESYKVRNTLKDSEEDGNRSDEYDSLLDLYHDVGYMLGLEWDDSGEVFWEPSTC